MSLSDLQHPLTGDPQLDTEHGALLKHILLIDHLVKTGFETDALIAQIDALIDLFRRHVDYEQKYLTPLTEGPALYHKVAHDSHHQAFLVGLEFLAACVMDKRDPSFLVKITEEKVHRIFSELMEFDQVMMRLYRNI
ncbi:hypothetical protein JCM17960_21260 [Magnetospira thiophila]